MKKVCPTADLDILELQLYILVWPLLTESRILVVKYYFQISELITEACTEVLWRNGLNYHVVVLKSSQNEDIILKQKAQNL